MIGNSRKRTLNIDINNIENISFVTIYVEYDKDKIGVFNCNRLNFIATFCSTTGDDSKTIWHEYKTYESYHTEGILNKYHLFMVNFSNIYGMKDTETTEVKVRFENAIDLDGNPITIEPCTEMFGFSTTINNSETSIEESPGTSIEDKQDQAENIISSEKENLVKDVPNRNSDIEKNVTNSDYKVEKKEDLEKTETKAEKIKNEENSELDESNIEKEKISTNQKKEEKGNYIYIMVVGFLILFISIAVFMKHQKCK